LISPLYSFLSPLSYLELQEKYSKAEREFEISTGVAFQLKKKLDEYTEAVELLQSSLRKARELLDNSTTKQLILSRSNLMEQLFAILDSISKLTISVTSCLAKSNLSLVNSRIIISTEHLSIGMVYLGFFSLLFFSFVELLSALCCTLAFVNPCLCSNSLFMRLLFLALN
jgi:hypothetical protein